MPPAPRRATTSYGPSAAPTGSACAGAAGSSARVSALVSSEELSTWRLGRGVTVAMLQIPRPEPPDPPHPRLRRAVHAADRAPRAREPGLLRSPPVRPPRRGDPAPCADRHHPLRRPAT